MKKMTRREKYLVSGTAVFISVFLILQLIVFPSIEKRNRLEETLKRKTSDLADMLILKSEFDDLKEKSERYEKLFTQKEKGFTLYSFLEQLAGNVGIKEKIAYIKPSGTKKHGDGFKISQVEMKLQDINTKELVPYLYRIETSRNMVVVRKISITKKSEKKGTLDALLQVETFEAG